MIHECIPNNYIINTSKNLYICILYKCMYVPFVSVPLIYSYKNMQKCDR